MTSLLTPPVRPATDTVRLVEPMPGFADVDFTLTNIDPDGLLLALRSVREPALRFVLTPARTFFPDYSPALGDDVATALDLPAGTELRCLLVLTIAHDLSDATANLRAPIVTAAGCDRALQVVLDDDTLSMHEPILPAVVPD